MDKGAPDQGEAFARGPEAAIDPRESRLDVRAGRAGILDGAFPPVEPDAAVWSRIEAELFPTIRGGSGG